MTDIHTMIEIGFNEYPDIVGFNVLTMNRVNTFKAIEFMRVVYPQIKIVLGGIHATLMYEQILKKYPEVIIIRGEGEITFADLLKNLDNLHNVDGIAFWENDRVVLNKNRELISDLDILPFPKHSLFFEGDRTTASILTSRGCPNNCSFCCLNPISKRTVRFRSKENVINEIKYLIDKFPKLKSVWIHDDSFFLDNLRVISICEDIIKYDLHKKVSFTCSGRFKPITQDMVNWLEKANFRTVMFGLESGSNRILARCNKHITQDDAEKAIRMFVGKDIDVSLFLIVGLPGEDWESVNETCDLVTRLQKIKYMAFKDIGILIVYPGTEVYDAVKDAGQITDNYWITDKSTPLYNVEHSIATLGEYKKYILNRISIDNIITIDGFRSQIHMIPHALSFVIKRKIRSLLEA